MGMAAHESRKDGLRRDPGGLPPRDAENLALIIIGWDTFWCALSSLVVSGNITTSGTLIIGNNNSYPNLQLGLTNGHSLGVAS